ncbi:unnamed protein product [Lactuca saligna]|uniref:Uncharacterized protein n=1 Tax=Lactuca saligna TaxID=75948 RepID=A0AA35VXM0_LACSI|nr:unnamed protein product [Lactuca saligna]
MANKEVILEIEDKDDDEDIQIVSATYVSPDGSSKAKKLEKIVDVMREGNKSRDYTGEEIEKELELMGLDDNEFADAFIYLLCNQADARTIFSSSMKM